MKKVLIAAAIFAALTGCDSRPVPVYAPASVVQAPAVVAAPVQPVVVVQQPSHDHFASSMAGAMAGTMIGNSLSRPTVTTSVPAAGPTTVINKTTIVKNVTVQQPAAKPAAPLPSVSKPAPAAPKLSLAKPAPSVSKSFGGFSRRK